MKCMPQSGTVLLGVALMLALTVPTELLSATDDNLVSTIRHLLEYVEESNCVFIRNGTDYSSKEAAQHLKAKYDFFMHKIKTPEDFIAVAGTKSILSGKPYWVRCDGHLMLSAEWLTKELSNYRKALHATAFAQ